jgi:hypothetical protein
MLAPPHEFADSLLATVTEQVDFFGQPLSVTAVPFSQQDTQIGRCAHVAAWICHYSAYLRGDVSRRAIADFSLRADANVAEGRPLPSQGLNALQLSNLMREFDLPPILYRMGSLPDSGIGPPIPDHDEDADPGTWDTRAVPILCRFLNSSYPVLVGTHDHAFVIVGYREYKDGGDSGTKIRFIRHHDQRGPYLWVDDILNDVDPQTGDVYTPWQLLLAPVPEKLWLLPEAAERKGRTLLRAFDIVAATGQLNDLEKQGLLTFRTSAMKSNHYKRILVERGLDPESVRELRLARMSRFVWVVEAVDRQAIGKVPAVVGEAVFDSTSSDLDPLLLALRVPSALLIQQTDGTIRSPLPATDQATHSVRRRAKS